MSQTSHQESVMVGEKKSTAAPIRPHVFFDIQVDNLSFGRIVIELFKDKTPRTCENFRVLCKGLAGSLTLFDGTVAQLHYRGTRIHRVIEGFIVQGGDITNGDGTGGASIYGLYTKPKGFAEFPDENVGWKNIDAAGLLCMANRGKNTNTSQFFITLAPAEYLSRRHTVFGNVVEGMEVVEAIGKLRVDTKDCPELRVVIVESGEVMLRTNQTMALYPPAVIKDRVPDPPLTEFGENILKHPYGNLRKRTHSKQSSVRGEAVAVAVSRDKDENRSSKRRIVEVSEQTGRDGDAEMSDSGGDGDRVSGGPSIRRRRSGPRSRHEASRPSRSRCHRRRSASPPLPVRGHRRDHPSRQDYDEGNCIRREGVRREMTRYTRNGMGLPRNDCREGYRGGKPSSDIKFKGRGFMKYRERRN